MAFWIRHPEPARLIRTILQSIKYHFRGSIFKLSAKFEVTKESRKMSRNQIKNEQSNIFCLGGIETQSTVQTQP